MMPLAACLGLLSPSFAAKGSFEAELEQTAGVLSSESTRQEAGPASWTDIELRSQWRSGAWRLGLPADLSHRQTYGFNLNETRANAGLKTKLSFEKQWLRAYVGAYGVYRPDWSDPYQLDAQGEPTPTDRHSYWSPRLRLQWGAKPWVHHRFVLEGQLRRPDYMDDPDYDEELAPTHIPPADNLWGTAKASWRMTRGPWRLQTEVVAHHKSYGSTYARDAGTGLTNATSDEPNPLYQVLDVEPSVEGRWEQVEGR